MSRQKSGLRFLTAWLGLALSAPLVWGQSSPPRISAPDALLRSFTNSRRVPLEMIQLRQPQSEPTPSMVKVAIDSRRRLRVDVIRPIVSEGVVSLDDGKEMSTYYPDSESVAVRISPYSLAQDPAERMKLIRQNYTLDIANGPRVAGQLTYKVSLKPRQARVGSQTLFIDRRRFITLRVESAEGDETKVLVDTVHITYRRPSVSFTLPPAKQVTEIWGPVAYSAFEKGPERLGFAPAVPKTLPFGFVTQAVHVLGSPEKPYVVARVTDGLLAVNLYLWSRTVHPRNPTPLDPLFSRDGVYFSVYGEAPPGVARTLLSSFVIERTTPRGQAVSPSRFRPPMKQPESSLSEWRLGPEVKVGEEPSSSPAEVSPWLLP